MKRFALPYVIPVLLMMALAVAPLLTGVGTLYTRDVLTTHYPLKVAQAEFLRRGEMPLVDPYRAGGQPLVGNPNGLPLYPDNLLYLVGSPLWALNAHFWLHWLLAPFAFYWLGRSWGLGRRASWAAGVCYAGSGFFLSLLNLYNMVAGAALTPAFIAAVLQAWKPRPQRYALALVGLLWGLLLLAGDPFFAALALFLAVTAALSRTSRWKLVTPRGCAGGSKGGRPLPPWEQVVFGRATRRLAMALGFGTLLAVPMLVEFLRILPLSFRGYWGYSIETALTQSWDPRTVVEWLLPFFFGQPDFSFWGQSFFGGNPPFLYSLFPGLLCLLLLATSGWPRRAALLWPWAAVAGGAFCALGVWNPLMHQLYRLPGVSSFRYPVKFWLAVAVGAALLCGLGFERLLRPGGTRRLGRVMGLLALVYCGLWILINTFGEALYTTLAPWAPERLTGTLFEWERLRWSGLCILALANLALLALALWVLRHRPGLGGALLLVVHLGAQCYFLAPLYHSDTVEPYLTPPEALQAVPEGARVVHGGFSQLFGGLPYSPLDSFPDSRFLWLARSQFAGLHPSAGVQWGIHYDFNTSPEGLDTFYTNALGRGMRKLPDAARLAVLRASGVDVLLLHRPLEAEAQSAVRLRATVDVVGQDHVVGQNHVVGQKLYVYDVLDSAAAVQLVGTVRRAPHMNGALDILTDPAFDPRTMVVLPGGESKAESDHPPGRAEVVAESADSLEVLVYSEAGGVLTTRRAFMGIYLATVDGRPATPLVANIHRLAVEVPPGEHRVRLWADRRFFHLGVLVAVLGLVGLVWTARREQGANG